MNSAKTILCFILFVGIWVAPLSAAAPPAAPAGAVEEGKEVGTVVYHVWSSPHPADGNGLVRDIFLQTELNSTFYQVMVQAAAANKDYVFEYIEYPFGRYITSIGGVKEDTTNNFYWMLFQVPSAPDVNSPPSDDYLTPVGVDGLRVKNNDIYLFWRKHVEFKK